MTEEKHRSVSREVSHHSIEIAETGQINLFLGQMPKMDGSRESVKSQTDPASDTLICAGLSLLSVLLGSKTISFIRTLRDSRGDRQAKNEGLRESVEIV